MKKYKQKISVMLLYFLFNTGSTIAQSPTDQPALMNITPPSPNAASLGKFGDIQIGPATGIPQITVPIYSYKNVDNTLKLDISLDYHAGGVKVDEVASNTGSGWALSAGGAITRTVRDIYDEQGTFGFMKSMTVPNEAEGNKRQGYGTITSYYNYIATHNADGQNDIFSFNFAGKSGQFMYGKNNDFLMLTSNKLKVEKQHGAMINGGTSDMIAKFTITDESGIKYVFDALELSDNGITQQNYHMWISSWYLTKIISPSSRDSIVFEYEAEYTSYTSGRFVTMTWGLPGFPSKNQETSYSTVITNGQRIKKINFPNGVNISFTYDTNVRQDMQFSEGLVRLKQISISDGIFTRGYNLYHDYSINRLALRKVNPYSAAGEETGYSFDYLGVLPSRLDNNQDHWGFYNNNPSNDMLPTYQYRPTGVVLQGGRRDTDTARVKIGTLKRMTYPTGGYTDFEMEANTSEDPRLTDSTVTYIKQKDFNKSVYCSSSAPTSEPFTFNGDAGSTTTFNVNVFQSGECTGSSACNFIVQIKNSSNQVLTTQTIANDGSFSYKDHSFSLTNLAKGNYTWYVYTTGMNYDNYMTMSWTEIRNQNPDTIRTVVKHLYVGGVRIKAIKTYDGIRPVPAFAKEFQYTQENSTKSSGSLGVLPIYEYPVYYQYHEYNTQSENSPYVIYNGNGLSNAIVRVSSPTQTLATINGSPVTYSRVVEKQINNGQNNGHIDRYFTSYTPGGLAGYNVFPFTTPQYFNWSFGQPEKELIYDQNETLLKKTENEYVTTIDNYYNSTQRLLNFTSVALGPVMYEVNAVSFDWTKVTQPYYYLARTFTPGAGRKDLKKSIVTEYANGQSFQVQTDYTYDTAFNVKNVAMTNSLGEKLEKIVTYPYEYTNSVAVAMKAQNMYSKEIAVESWKTKGSTRYLSGGYINQYVQHSSGIRSAGIGAFSSLSPVVSSSVGAFNPASFNRDAILFKDLISFSQYTSKGYLNEQSKVGDLKHAYIYGYKGSYVIAEAVNALANEIAYTGFDEDGKGNWTYAGVPASDAVALSVGKVYNLSAGAISKSGLTSGKSYKISYWSKSTTASVNGSSGIQKASRNGWVYFEHILAAGTTSVSVQGNVVIDELRLYPADATMHTYTYQPLYGIIGECNAKNEFQSYLYDGLGRLKVIKDQDGRILKQIDYQIQVPVTK